MVDQLKTIELKPIQESTEDYEKIEKKITDLFKQEIYYPLLKILSVKKKTLQNSLEDLEWALQTGKITFSGNSFAGSFNASLSKELKKLGAKFDRASGTFKIDSSILPVSVRSAISVSEARFHEKIAEINSHLSKIAPEEIGNKLNIADNFDSTIYKVEKEFKKNARNIIVSPQLSPEQRKRVADEWQNNMKLWIKNFTEKEIVELRRSIQDNVYSGNRREGMIKTIQKSYGVSERKAKFLARQETNLMLTTYKVAKYTSAGVQEYKWGCVKMPHQPTPKAPYLPGEVRYHHGIHEGKIFRFDNPPVVNDKGERKNPGMDYNCRCFAIPIVKFTVS